MAYSYKVEEFKYNTNLELESHLNTMGSAGNRVLFIKINLVPEGALANTADFKAYLIWEKSDSNPGDPLVAVTL